VRYATTNFRFVRIGPIRAFEEQDPEGQLYIILHVSRLRNKNRGTRMCLIATTGTA